tara:strand:- start:1205 stop:2047 length:843 start_codon:yes stop_codon:yes gene_type:complete
MNKDTTIVLISHKSKDLILKFIKEIYNKFEIIIIDNSKDKELEKEIKQNYSKITIKFVENNGYGAAINYGSKLVKTNYFLISNPDIEGINEKNITKFLVSAKKLNDKFSSLGPRYINADPKSHVQSDLNKEIAEMKFISGACMFFKKESFKILGGFDENFFLYFEESDFCLRSYKKNKNYQINTIKIKHNVGTSVVSKNIIEKKKIENLYTWHFIWSKFYYHKKHYSYLGALIYFSPIIIRIIFRIVYYSFKKDIKKIEKYKIRWSGLMNSIRGNKSYKR